MVSLCLRWHYKSTRRKMVLSSMYRKYETEASEIVVVLVSILEVPVEQITVYGFHITFL